MSSQTQTFQLWDKEERKICTVEAKKNGSTWMALCPKHDDHNPSLGITEEEGLYNCLGCGWSGCLYDPGYERERDFDNRIEDIYSYRGPDGTLAYEIFRGRDKSFWAKGVNAEKGLDNEKPILYNSDQLAKADKDTLVIVVEGEKDANNLMKLAKYLPREEKFITVTNPFGAGKWKDGYSKQLQGFNVAILYDNDEPGRKHRDQVAKSLSSCAKSIGIIHPKSFRLEEKQDISDWLARHSHIRKGVLARVFLSIIETEASPYHEDTGEVCFLSARDILDTKFEIPDQIVDGGLIPAQGKMILAGYGGIGKSLLVLQWALELAWQKLFLGRFDVLKPGLRILIIQQENPLWLMKARLQKMLTSNNEDLCNRVFFTDPANSLFTLYDPDIGRLIANIEKSQADVLILDPLIAFHHEHENDNSKMRQVLDQITSICNTTGVATIVTHHFKKPSESDVSTDFLIRGAQAIFDWSDSAISLIRLKSEGDRNRLQVNFNKVRTALQPSSLLLERCPETLLCHPIEEEDLCPPNKVLEILINLGGKIATKKEFIEAIRQHTNLGWNKAIEVIDKAAETGTIKSNKYDKDRKTTDAIKYFVPEKD